jgi:hypothetical protein
LNTDADYTRDANFPSGHERPAERFVRIRAIRVSNQLAFGEGDPFDFDEQFRAANIGGKIDGGDRTQLLLADFPAFLKIPGALQVNANFGEVGQGCTGVPETVDGEIFGANEPFNIFEGLPGLSFNVAEVTAFGIDDAGGS